MNEIYQTAIKELRIKNNKKKKRKEKKTFHPLFSQPKHYGTFGKVYWNGRIQFPVNINK